MVETFAGRYSSKFCHVGPELQNEIPRKLLKFAHSLKFALQNSIFLDFFIIICVYVLLLWGRSFVEDYVVVI